MAKCILPINAEEIHAVFRKNIDKFLNSFSDRDPASLFSALKTSVVLSDNPELIGIFDNVIRTYYKQGVVEPIQFTQDRKLPRQARVVKDLPYEGFMADGFLSSSEAILELNNNEESEDPTEKSFESDITLADKGGESLKGDAGLDGFNTRFNWATGKNHIISELAEMFKVVKQSVNFDGFKSWIQEKYETAKGRVRERALQVFYNTHTEQNEQKRSAITEFMYLNFDDKIKFTDYKEDFVKTITGKKKFVNALNFDLNNKSEVSEYVSKTFLDTSKALIHGTPIQKMTGVFKLNSIGKLVKTKDGKSWFFKSQNQEVTPQMYKKWEYELTYFETAKGNPVTYTIVEVVPGDTGRMFLTRVLDEHVEALFPKEQVVNALNEVGLTKPANVISGLPKEISILEWFRNAQEAFEDNRNKKDILDRYNLVKSVVSKIGVESLESYFNKEVGDKNMTVRQMNLMLNGIRRQSLPREEWGKAEIPFVTQAASILARHDWLQATRGYDYMMHEGGDTFHLSTRLKLTNGSGVILEGVGDTRSLIYDQDKVKIFYKDPLKDDAPLKRIKNIREIFNTNINDGGAFTSTNRLLKVINASGANPITKDEFIPRNIKTVRSQLERDEKTRKSSYIEYKLALHEMPAGIIIKSKNNRIIAESILWYDENDKPNVIIEDGKGGTYDDIGDLDVVKTSSGKYDIRKHNVSSMEVVIKEESERLINVPHYGANLTSYGPVQLLYSLNYDLSNADETTQKQFNQYKNVITNILLNQANIYNDILIRSHQDPNSLRDLLKFVWSRKSERNDSLKDKLFETDGKGIHHPDNLTPLMPMLLNMIIGNGSLKARTYDSKINKEAPNAVFGSNFILKPDIAEEVEDLRNVILPSNVGGNQVIYNAVKKRAEDKGVSIPDTKALNDWMHNNRQYILAYRSPIGDISSVQAVNIQEFRDEMGNSAIHHPEFVIEVLIGDYDIDDTGTILLNPKDAKIINSFQNTTWFKSQLKNADLDMFLKIAPYNVASYNQRRASNIDIIKGMGLQGMATNMKSVGSTMSMHFGELAFTDGTVVFPKKLTDEVVMDYAPLDPSFDRTTLPAFASVTKPDADGNIFLKTTVAHEYLLIINAATDHSSKKVRGMLTNMWGLEDSNWFLERMYHIKKTPGGKGSNKLTTEAINALRKIQDLYKYSNIKKMKTDDGYRMNMHKFITETGKIKRRLVLDKEYLSGRLMEEVMTTNSSGTRTFGLIRADIKEGVITPEEKLITSLYDMIESELDSDSISPLMYSSERYQLTHLYTREELINEFKDDVENLKYSQEELDNGHQFSKDFNKQFTDIFTRTKKKKEDEIDVYLNQRVEYSDKLYKLTEESIPVLENLINQHGEGVRDIFTLYTLSGLHDVKNIRMIPPLKSTNTGKYLLSSEVYVNYMNKWESNFFNRVNGTLNSSTMMSEITDLREAETPTFNLITMNKKRKDC